MPAANIGTVEGYLKLNDQFSPALVRASAQLQQFGKKMQATGATMSAAGRGLTTALTLPLAVIGGIAVKSFADFDAAMVKSIAIMGDVSGTLKNEMAVAARETAKTTIFSAEQSAESYFFLASAGLDAASSIAALPTVSKFAQAGMFDMALATDLLTDAQSALGLTIRDDAVANMENMIRVSDVLVRANTLANATVQQFSESLTTEAGAALKSFHIDVEEGVAVLAAFADQGVKGQVAGTGLSRILRLMTDAAVKNSEAYKKWNVEVFDSFENINNLADIIGQLEDALGSLADRERTNALIELGFRAKVQGVILPLLGTSEAIRKYEKELRSAGGFTEDVAAKQLESFTNQIKLLKNQLTDAAITLGEAMVPTLKSFIQGVVTPGISALAKLAKAFGSLPGPVRSVIITAAALLAALGPVIWIAGSLITSWGAIAAAAPAVVSALGSVVAFLTGPVGIAVAAVAVLASIRPVREFFVDLASNVFSKVSDAIGIVVVYFKALWDSTAPVRSVGAELFSFVSELTSLFVKFAGFVGGTVSLAIQDLFDHVSGGARWFDILGQALQGSIDWFGSLSEAIARWWKTTKTARDFAIEFAQVALADIARWISRLISLYVDHIKFTIEVGKRTYEAVKAFLVWSGALDIVRTVIRQQITGLKLLVEWIGEAATRVVEWVRESNAFLRILAVFNPALAAVVAKVEEWADEAGRRLAASLEEGGKKTEEQDEKTKGLVERLKELLAAAEGAGGGVTTLTNALKDALKQINSTIAANVALFDALSESQHAYDVLEVLLQNGIPLADALTGAYDKQGEQLLLLQKALDGLTEKRKTAQEVAESLAETERQMADDLDALIAARQNAAEQNADVAVPFDPPEGITDSYIEILTITERIRASERERADLSKEIQSQLAAGAISIQEAYEIAQGLGVEFKHWTTTLAEGFDAVGQIVGTFNRDLGRALQRAGDLVRLYQQAGANISSTQALGAVAGNISSANSQKYAVIGTVVGAAIGAAIGGYFAGPHGAALGAKWGAVIGSWVGSLIKTGVKAFYGEIQAAVGGVFIGQSPEGGGFREIADAIGGQIAKTIDDILFLVGAELQSISGGITISHRRGWSVIVDGIVHYFEDNADAALSFAITEALQRATITGASPEVIAALANTIAEDIDSLFADLKIAVQVRDLDLQDVQRAFRQTAQDAEFLRKRAEELGFGLEALERIARSEVRNLGTLRDSILGIQEDPADRIRRQSALFNSELALREADLQARRAELQARAEILRVQISLAEAGIDIGQQSSLAQAALLGVEIDIAATMLQTAEAAAEALEAIVGQIASIDEALAGLAGLIITDADIAGAIGRLGGGTRQSDLQQLRDLIDQMRFDRLLEGMTDLEAGLARLDREYQSNLERAHGNAGVIAALTEEYRLQAEQLLLNIQLSAVDTFQSFIGIGGDPFSQLRDGWDAARTAVEDAGFGAVRTATMLDRLSDSYEHQLDVLSRQQLVAIGDGLLGILERYYGGVEGFEEFRMNLERVRFELELGNLRVQFLILQAQGTVSEAVLARLGEVFEFIDEHPIDWGAFIMPPAVNTNVARAANDLNDTLAEMARRLVSAKDNIRDFLLALQTGQFGGRSSKQQLEAALAQFQQVREQSQAGNIQAIEQFPEIARRLLEIARSRFASGSEFQDILAMVENAGIDALGVSRVTQDKVIFDQRFFDQQRDQLNVNQAGFGNLASVSRTGFSAITTEQARSTGVQRETLEELRLLRISQDALARRIEAIESRRRTEKAA